MAGDSKGGKGISHPACETRWESEAAYLRRLCRRRAMWPGGAGTKAKLTRVGVPGRREGAGPNGRTDGWVRTCWAGACREAAMVRPAELRASRYGDALAPGLALSSGWPHVRRG